MSQLVFVENNQVVTDSLTIAEVFGKDHDNVLRDIRNQIEKLIEAGEKKFSLLNFEESDYKNERGRKYPKINLTEEAFALVAMAYVTPEAMKMKVKFINEFRYMREQLSQPKALSERQALVQSLKLTAELAEEVEEVRAIAMNHDNKIIELERKVEEQITLDHAEQRRLQKAVAKKVYDHSNSKAEASVLFRELYREIKDRFGVASYKDVKRKELQDALNYINYWIPKRAS